MQQWKLVVNYIRENESLKQKQRQELKKISYRRKWQQADNDQNPRKQYVAIASKLFFTITQRLFHRKQLNISSKFKSSRTCCKEIADSFLKWRRLANPKKLKQISNTKHDISLTNLRSVVFALMTRHSIVLSTAFRKWKKLKTIISESPYLGHNELINMHLIKAQT